MQMTDKKFELVIDTETNSANPHEAEMFGFSTTCNDATNYLQPKDISQLKASLEMPVYVITQNGKYDQVVLNKHRINFEVNYDSYIAEYLLHINKPRNLEAMYERYTGKRKKCLLDLFNEANKDKSPRARLPEDWYETVYTPKGKVKHFGVSMEVLAQYAKEDVEATYAIYKEQLKEFEKKPDLYKWFTEIEIPIVNILAKTEIKGVKLDLEQVKALALEVDAKRTKVLKDILWYCGVPTLNLNSPKQLQEVMYNKLKLPKLKETKSGWSTDKQVLGKLKDDHAFAKLLLEYSEYDHLLTSFLKPLPEKVDKNARLHTTYNQALTDTRRFSSENPNLQNIPTKSDLGKRIRECFVPETGHKFLIADYDQIELRLLAHFSEDPTLLEAFHTGQDVHQKTAELISARLGRDFPRPMGKLLNFSLIYGKTAFGFAQDWGCSIEEAKEIIFLYFQQFPRVKEWMDETVKASRLRKSWGKSIAGLPLHICAKDKKGDFLGDLFDQRDWVRQAAERTAINYPIQSSSQDILKTAMVRVYKRLNLVPVLMVHDEVVYEITDNEHSVDYPYVTADSVVDEMEAAWNLKVPLKVSWKIADKWEK